MKTMSRHYQSGDNDVQTLAVPCWSEIWTCSPSSQCPQENDQDIPVRLNDLLSNSQDITAADDTKHSIIIANYKEYKSLFQFTYTTISDDYHCPLLWFLPQYFSINTCQ